MDSQPGMYVEPGTFAAHIGFLKDNFRIISAAEALSEFRKGRIDSISPGSKPLCTLTFDDGWHDFHTHAFPVLNACQVPATVFLPTDFIGTPKWFWTDRLTYIFHRRNTLRKPSCANGRPAAGDSADHLERLAAPEGEQFHKALSLLKSRRDEEIEEILNGLSRKWGIDPSPPTRAFLSWEEVGEMAKTGLITFGSHTAGHRLLTTLTEVEIREELARSRDILINRKAVDRSCIPFCYPNGNYTTGIAEMVKEAGYSLAVTTGQGWNPRNSDLFTLKRVAVQQDMTATPAMFKCRIAGVF